jgi:RNA polymerase sigma factor (sigma-70 family)
MSDHRVTKPESGLTPDEPEKLAREHRPLVVRWCQRLIGKAPIGMDSDEVMGYAMRGLAHALNKYDTTRKVTFGAFAGQWIRGAILRGFNRDGKSLPWRGQILDRLVDGKRSRWETLVERDKAKGSTILVAAMLLDGLTERQMEEAVIAIEKVCPTRLAVLTGEDTEELLAQPDTRRLVKREEMQPWLKWANWVALVKLMIVTTYCGFNNC